MVNITRAFMDATCPLCGKRFGWNGNLLDRPVCPKCGHRPTEEDRQAAQDRFDAMLKKAKRTGS